ncbi:transporter substrate-binding domain-containing protein [Salidesulfovibrio onnuriiensis]|uniref:substrate-binding periplasmic protein n=1 Tax=Salidesulfovibrio onnuriiensis TaxID=2583823 RepID=UPI00164F96A8
MTMRYAILCLLLWALLAPPPALAQQSLRIGVPCYKAEQCKPAELMAILSEACTRANVSSTFVIYPMLRDLEEANNGNLDASGARSAEAIRGYPNLVQVPVPIARMSIVFFSKEYRKLKPSWDSLAGLRVGVMRGQNTVSVLAGEAGVPFRSFSDPAKAFQLLEQDRLDAIIMPRSIGLSIVRDLGLQDILASPPIATRDIYLSLHRKHADLVPLFSNVLRSMHRDGSMKRLAGQFADMVPDELSEPE